MENKPIGRKQRRTQIKLDKKTKKRNYFGNCNVNNAEEILKQKKKEKLLKSKERQKQRKSESGAFKRKRKRAKMEQNKKGKFDQDNGQDEVTIHRLEKLMYIRNKKKLPKSFADDGLDFILDVVNSNEDNEVGAALILNSEDELSDVSDQNEIGSGEELLPPVEDNESLEDQDSNETTNSDDYEASSVSRQTNNESLKTDIKSTIDSIVKESVTNKSTLPAVEPIKYIPPALRKDPKDLSEKTRRLQQQIKGQLNRVSESNLSVICSEIEALYQRNSRAMMTDILTDSVLGQFDTVDPIPERLITESVMVVTVLGHNIGHEVVAHFTEMACKKINELLHLNEYGAGKSLNNFVQLLCSLYQLKAIQSKIVLDLASTFIDKFDEKDIELLVLILKNVGFQIRKDDPVVLKSTIEKITLKSQDVNAADASRTKYMIDVLTAIKNNNVRKLTGYDVELINSRRKKIKTICKGESDIFPNVSFEDMIEADSKGRWWIVGSHWKGLPMLSNRKDDEKTDAVVSSQLVEAARKLKMNTDVRKKIFYAVMSAVDFLDAFESIFRIGLKGKQLREVAYVLVECCQREKTYNPFYFHLLNKLCHYERQFVMTIQCSFWDRIKQLKLISASRVKNIITLLAELILSEALPLSCLKTIDYAEMDQIMVSFLRQVFVHVALNIKSDVHINSIFSKLSGQNNRITRQGLKLFLQHFILHDEKFIQEHFDLKDNLTKMSKNLVGKKGLI